MDSDIDDKKTLQSQQITWARTKIQIYTKIPILPETARKVARLEKIKLDVKQYIAYEMIACTFLLTID